MDEKEMRLTAEYNGGDIQITQPSQLRSEATFKMIGGGDAAGESFEATVTIGVFYNGMKSFLRSVQHGEYVLRLEKQQPRSAEDRLKQFLYILMRDYVVSGSLEKIIAEHLDKANTVEPNDRLAPVHYSAYHMSEYAEELMRLILYEKDI